MKNIEEKKIPFIIILFSILMMFFGTVTKYYNGKLYSTKLHKKPPLNLYEVNFFGIEIPCIGFFLFFLIILGIGAYLFIFKFKTGNKPYTTTLEFVRKNMRIKLKCGREVKVDGFEFGTTYGGLLEGSPYEIMNKNIFEKTTHSSNWGKRRVLKIKPENSEFKNSLKPTHYSVWLTSNDPINSNYHGSELVVIWFDELPNGRTIEEIIQTGVQNIDWNKNAKDFEY